MVTAKQRRQRVAAGSTRSDAKKKSAALNSGLRRFELRRLAEILKSDPRACSHPSVVAGLRELWTALNIIFARPATVAVDPDASHSGYEIKR